MNITLILASPNHPSNSETVAQSFVEGINSVENANIATVHLSNMDLAYFTPEYYEEGAVVEEDFQKFESIIQASDGIVIATPVWNFGVPGKLKNLLDRMGSFALDKEQRRNGQLNGLPFYLIFTGGAPTVAWKGLMHNTTAFVREGLKYFGCTFIGHLYEGGCAATPKGSDPVVLAREDSLQKARERGSQFGKIVQGYASDGSLPAKYKRKNKIYRMLNNLVSKLVKA